MLIRPFISGNVIHLGEDILYASFGGGVEVSRQVNDGLGVTLRYDVRRKRYDNNTSRPEASDEDGVEQSGHVTAAISITPTVNAFARARLKSRRARVDYEANREYGGLAGLSVSYEPPVGNPSRRWLTSLSGEFSYVKHDAPYPAVSPTTPAGGQEMGFARADEHSPHEVIVARNRSNPFTGRFEFAEFQAGQHGGRGFRKPVVLNRRIGVKNKQFQYLDD